MLELQISDIRVNGGWRAVYPPIVQPWIKRSSLFRVFSFPVCTTVDPLMLDEILGSHWNVTRIPNPSGLAFLPMTRSLSI